MPDALHRVGFRAAVRQTLLIYGLHRLWDITCLISHYILSQYKYQVSQYTQFIQGVIFGTIFMVMNHVEANGLGI